MKISQKGLDELIKPCEGYLAKQPDGSCRAYRCPAGVWTCGWGCTEGVTANTQWTLIEAEAALRAEMAKHEAAVEAMVTVPLNQGQFDALVSLSYNIGAAAVARSTLLAHLNAGDYARAASHFSDFKRARVRGATAQRMRVPDGTSVVLPGLVTRRAAEMQFFLAADPVADAMPQRVEPPRTKLDVKGVLTKVAAPVAAGTAAVGEVIKQGVPAVPEVATKSLEHVGAWKRLGGGVLEVGREIVGVVSLTGRLWPYVLGAGIGSAVLGVLLWQRRNADTST